jgi:hypothetical protein
MDEVASTIAQNYPNAIGLIEKIGAPFVALVAAIFAGLIAYRQWKVAHDKLRLDLFEKRYVMYGVLTSTIATTLQDGTISSSEITRFYRQTKGSEFLFGSDIEKYIGELRDKLSELASLEQEISSQIGNDKDHAAKIRRSRKLKDWLEAELMGGARNKFEKYISFGHLK